MTPPVAAERVVVTTTRAATREWPAGERPRVEPGLRRLRAATLAHANAPGKHAADYGALGSTHARLLRLAVVADPDASRRGAYTSRARGAHHLDMVGGVAGAKEWV